jgi:hypothetical protein
LAPKIFYSYASVNMISRWTTVHTRIILL